MYQYPKALMTIKDMIKEGYPREMLLEIANMQGTKSVIRRGEGRKIWFQANRFDEDVEMWKKINCR